MNREELIADAAQLRQPSAEAAAAFSDKREVLAAAVNRAMAQRPDLEKLVGPAGRLMSEDNNRNFALFMESLWQGYRPEILVDTVLWVFRTYRSHGFAPIYWPANLDTWREHLRVELSAPVFREIGPFYSWLITHIPFFTALTDIDPIDTSMPVSQTFHGT
ncbi:MAG: hypothetical protein V2J11_07380 [Desulfofustis sp.]|jgi:hypothetical protein|nr:hypothetical protein [Desulfofustis sp.]